jgi:hypothetical protein
VNAARRPLTLVTSIAGAMALTLFAGVEGADAQSATTISPPPRAQAVTPRRAGQPPADDQQQTAPARSAPVNDPNADGDAPREDGDDDAPAGGTQVGLPGATGTAARGAAQTGEATAGQRRVVRDGDLAPVEDAPVLDGIIVTGEPLPPLDGADPSQLDNRSPDDIAVFESPAAGFDPQLFQAELDPILDRRPAQLFRFEPYDPIGIRMGSFVLLPEAELGGTFYSNLFKSPSARKDVSFDVKPSARLVSNWRQHAIEFRGTGSLTFLNENPSENDRNYSLEARGRFDLGRRTNIESLLSRGVTQESRSSVNAATDATSRADIKTDTAALALNHRFNRLGLQLRGSVTDVNYEPVTLGTGQIRTNNDRDLRTTEQALRASWEFKPTLFAFVEAGLNQRGYKTAALTDGIVRDSTGERYRTGIGFGNTGQRIRGEISVGYAHQAPTDGRLAAIAGLIVDANLAYRASALTSFLMTAKSDVSESSLSGSGGALARQVGLEVRHAFRRQLLGNAGLNYSVSDFSGVSQVEKEARASLGLEYFMNRDVMLYSRYQHTAFTSTDQARNYNADELRVGVRIRR